MPTTAALVHSARGRARIKVEGPTDEVRALLATASRAAGETPLVARPSARTRTLLVEWDADQIDSEHALELMRGLDRRLRQLELPAGHHQRYDGKPSKVAARIESRFDDANKRVSHATEGVIDLRMLVPAGLAALSLRQLLRTGPQLARMPWYVLAYYAFDTFIKLHHTAPTDLRPLAEELAHLESQG